MERTSISDIEQHGHKDVVHKVQSDAISKKSIPHHQQVLKRKFPAKQQTNPPAKDTENKLYCICVQQWIRKKEKKKKVRLPKGVNTDIP